MDTEFEKIEVNAEDILHFDEGLYGFEEIREYVLLTEDDTSGIFYMQAVHTKVPSFVLIDPFIICQTYQPLVSSDDMAHLNTTDQNELRFLAVAAIKENYKDTVANLKCPIAINPYTKHARQVILENTDYPIRHKIYPDGGEKSC